jgi:KaiC/GvpD/RAD55 family RecA-like ATPase
MAGSADDAAPPSASEASRTDELAKELGLPETAARRLVKAGYTNAEAVRGLSTDQLERLGFDAAMRHRLHPEPGAAGEAEAKAAEAVDSERIVERWVGNVHRGQKGRRPKVGAPNKRSADILRRWVDGDDRALEDWIRSADEESVPLAPPSGGPSGPASVVTSADVAAGATAMLEREATVVRWLTSLLDRVKSDQFDPAALLQEVQELHRHLYDERAKRRQLEEQIEHVKRGSIAVIKYVRSREAKGRESALKSKEDEIAELRQMLNTRSGRPVPETPGVVRDLAGGPPAGAAAPVANPPGEDESRLTEAFTEREREYIERETELRRRIVQLEGETRRLTNDLTLAQQQSELSKGAPVGIDTEITRRIADLNQRERDLIARENELRAKFEEIRLGAEENERRKAPIEFKERSLAAYDQQLQTRREALDLEARRLETLRHELGEGTVIRTSEAQRLDDMRHELAKKEEELRGREAQLAERVREVERIAGIAATADAEQLHADSVTDSKASRAASGVRRLDDLLYGGIPSGAQVLVNGPAHTGRDVLARLFSIEGLRRKIPTIWVITDKTYGQLRDDLQALYPGFAEAERNGLLRYVDLYSLGVGSTGTVPGVRFLSPSDKAVLDQLSQTVNGFAEQLKQKFSTYRLVFETVSTVTAYLDTSATFRFLQPFIGRRKLDGAVAYYELESGMHTESDMETLEHMVDGSLNLKIEQMKTFFSVRGLGDAQARTWIGYNFTKRSFNLGSFSLEHIR